MPLMSGAASPHRTRRRTALRETALEKGSPTSPTSPPQDEVNTAPPRPRFSPLGPAPSAGSSASAKGARSRRSAPPPAAPVPGVDRSVAIGLERRRMIKRLREMEAATLKEAQDLQEAIERKANKKAKKTQQELEGDLATYDQMMADVVDADLSREDFSARLLKIYDERQGRGGEPRAKSPRVTSTTTTMSPVTATMPAATLTPVATTAPAYTGLAAIYTHTLEASTDPAVKAAETMAQDTRPPRAPVALAASKGVAAIRACAGGSEYPRGSSVIPWMLAFDNARTFTVGRYGDQTTPPTPSEVGAELARMCRHKNPDTVAIDQGWLAGLPTPMAMAAIDSFFAFMLVANLAEARPMIVIWTGIRHKLALCQVEHIADLEATLRHHVVADIEQGGSGLDMALANPASPEFAAMFTMLVTEPTHLHIERQQASHQAARNANRGQNVVAKPRNAASDGQATKSKRADKVQPKTKGAPTATDACRDYNRGMCKRSKCAYRHICSGAICLPKALPHPLAACKADDKDV